MDQSSKSSPGNGRRDPGEEARRREKRPYVKPAFVRESVFEATALACGKINPTVRQCNLVRKKS
jgi:hypothetical protein